MLTSPCMVCMGCKLQCNVLIVHEFDPNSKSNSVVNSWKVETVDDP